MIESAPGAPASWSGAELAFGEARLRADWGIPRCAIITLDPITAARDLAVLRMVAQRFGNLVGMYCSVAAPGTIRVGDVVRIL